MENTNTQTNEHAKAHNTMRNVLIALVLVGFTTISFLAYKNPQLLTASLTGGADSSSVTKDIYISADYKAEAGDSGYIEIKAGKDMEDLSDLKVTLSAPTSQLTISSVHTDNCSPNCLLGSATFTTDFTSSPGDYEIDFNFAKIATVNDNDPLFRLLVATDSSLNSGNTIPITLKTAAGDSTITDKTSTRTPTFEDGLITIGTTTATDLCKNITVPTYSTCDPVTGKWTCNKGYDTAYNCTACSIGYSGYPTCTLSLLADIKGMVLTLDDETLQSFDATELDKAWTSAYIMLNSTQSAGALLTVESNPITVPTCTDVFALTEKALVECMVSDPNGDGTLTDGLAALIESVPGVNINTYPNVPGLLKLTSTTGNADDSLEGILSSSGEVLVLPGMDYTLTLTPTASYKTRIVGKNGANTDVTVVELKYDDVTWVPQPTDRLDATALKGGLLEKGAKTGKTPLYTALSLTDGSTLDSINRLTIDVPSAPTIEYLRRIGTNPVQKGGRINLSVKIYDEETISDIKDIRVSLVSTLQTTYTTIKNDASAVWFTAIPHFTEVSEADGGTQTTTSTTDTSTTSSNSTTTSTTSTPTIYNYKIYSIPVDIPQDENLINGNYKLVLEVSDTKNNVAPGLMDLAIGASASGDVDGNGSVSMLDVIKAFQIANGISATQTELQAADLNNDGNVTMLDVIILFKQIN